jgi:hypothetical protein
VNLGSEIAFYKNVEGVFGIEQAKCQLNFDFS